MSKKAIATEADGTMSTKDKVLHSAAVMFLERGYEKTSIREIADHAGVNRGSVLFAIKSKEHLLCMLVAYVLESQFETSKKLMAGKTADPVLYYAVETALQLYMAESSEAVRELYAVAYSLPSTSELIYRMVTEKLELIFKAYNPGWKAQDFYEREIATGSIIRGYMAKPCAHSFTIERKLRAFLETSLTIYHVPQEKTEEAFRFVCSLDFETIAKKAVEDMVSYLKEKI